MMWKLKVKFMEKANFKMELIDCELTISYLGGGVLGSNTLYCNIFLSHGMNNIMAF